MVRIDSWTDLGLGLLGLAFVGATFNLARDYAISCLAGSPHVTIAYEAVLAMILSVACFAYILKAYPVLSRRKD